jgi:hypothetical protein
MKILENGVHLIKIRHKHIFSGLSICFLRALYDSHSY